MRLYLVRHGETVWNIESRFQGWADRPLSELGVRQARELARRLSAVKFDAAYSSDLRRAADTAKILLEDRGIPVQQMRDLREMHLGELDGLTEAEVLERYPAVIKAWRTDPADVVMPGGESLSQVQERAWRGLMKVWKENPGGTVLLVSHHTVNKAILSRVLEMPPAATRRLRQPPCSLSIIEFLPDRFFIHALNHNWMERSSLWLDLDEAGRERVRRSGAVILDMDGVLLDSMPYWAAAWRLALAECGVLPPEIEFYRRESEDADLSVRHFFAEAGKEADAKTVEKIARRVTEIYWGFPTIGPRPGAFEVCRRLKDGGKLLAMVTGSPREEVRRFLTGGQIELFDAIVSRDDVKHGKPHPEPFLAALEKLDLSPKEAIVVENAPLGIRAAKAAGILTLALSSTLPPEELHEADFVIDSLDRLPGWLDVDNHA
jgi:HAD superfamily hydrolase (TIGR01509 family)